MNLPGSLTTSAARSSLGKPKPSRSSSGDTDAYTIRPIRYLVWSRTRCSEVRGNAMAIRRTSAAPAMPQTLPPRAPPLQACRASVCGTSR
jgi:hypothetical protein